MQCIVIIIFQFEVAADIKPKTNKKEITKSTAATSMGVEEGISPL